MDMDVMFVLDGSGSIGIDNFETVKTWVKNVTNSFEDAEGTARFGVIQYSHYDGHK